MSPIPLRLALVLLLSAVAVVAFPPAGSAHRLDEYLQATLVEIEPGAIRLQINLVPGAAVAEEVLALIDRDANGTISKDEATAYGEAVQRDLIVRCDGGKAELKLVSSSFPEPAELRAGVGIIQLEFSVVPAPAAPLAPAAHQFALENRHLPKLGVYLFNAAKPKTATVQITAQKRNENQSTGEIGFTLSPPVNASR